MLEFNIGDFITYKDYAGVKRNAIIIGKKEDQFIIIDEVKRPLILEKATQENFFIDEKYLGINNWRRLKGQLEPFDYKFREEGSTKIFDEICKFLGKITGKDFNLETNKEKIKTLVKQNILVETPPNLLIEDKKELEEKLENFISEEMKFMEGCSEEKLEKILGFASELAQNLGPSEEGINFNFNFSFTEDLLKNYNYKMISGRKIKCEKCHRK